jgi:hypothetical protein
VGCSVMVYICVCLCVCVNVCVHVCVYVCVYVGVALTEVKEFRSRSPATKLLPTISLLSSNSLFVFFNCDECGNMGKYMS